MAQTQVLSPGGILWREPQSSLGMVMAEFTAIAPEGRNETRSEIAYPSLYICGPSGANPQRASSPHEPRIVFNFMFAQNRQELGLEIALSMMLFLPRDVPHRRLNL